MSKKIEAQIKRFIQNNATPPDTAASKEKWSATEGGNVLSWLQQRAPQQPSRGAIDYLSKVQLNEKTDAQKQASLPKPRSQQQQEQQHELSQQPQQPSQPQQPQQQQQTTNTTAVRKLAQLFPGAQGALMNAPRVKVGDAVIVMDNTKTVMSEPQQPQLQDQQQQQQRPTETVALPRSHRGRNRRETKEERLKRRFEKMTEEAQKRHEEALRTDPEYKKKYQTFQELQAAQQAAQGNFLERYARQEHINLSTSVSERLDIPVILDLIEQHDVVFICTDTGSGKSTSIPKALLELSNDTRVVSTQPRRTATVSIASRVAALRRENVGEDVGYWIRGDKRGDDQTRLWYMTSYTLLLYLLNNPLQPPFTHIVLDEFHERQPDIEVTVALLRLCLLRRTANFKLILMSATLNTEDWEQYFTGLKVATYKQSEPEHPIHDYFMEDVCALIGAEYNESPNVVDRGVDFPLLEKHMFIAQNLISYLNMYADPQHAILVFLPGRAQVEQLQLWLESNMRKPMDIVAWHSAVDLAVIEEAIGRRLPFQQKIYLATDIAEVSITLPDVVFVIDLVLVKRPKINKDDPATVLHPPLLTQWISKGSVAQRRGRIGRVQQGFYFCLLPSSSVGRLPDHADPPIENSRIDELSLHCLQLVSNPVAIFSICHGQPLIETITLSMDTLSQLGCIVNSKDPHAAGERIEEIHSNSQWSPLVLEEAKKVVLAEINNYEYTFIGRILQLIPVSPQPGMLVFYGFLTGLESLMILAAAVTSSLSPFAPNPLEQKRRKRQTVVRAMEETENVMRNMCCGLRSDIVAVMKAVLMFRVCVSENGEDPATIVRQWCLDHHLSYDKLKAILDLEQHIKYELANFIPFRDVVDPQELLAQLEKVAPIVLVMTNVAFVAQSLEVTTEGNTYTNSKETAVGLFTDIAAVPDIHSPSCLRWQEGDIVIPVQLSLLGNRMIASFSTAIASHKQFWLSLLLLTHRLQYATFADDEGAFHVFSVKYYGTERYVETDASTGYAVLHFRQQLSTVCQTLRLLHDHQEMYDDEFAELLQKYKLKPLEAAQRDVIVAIAAFFNNTESITVDEVEHDDDDLDEVSIISLALPKLNHG
ncbi:putative ATP-dependent RNA helicase [Trypanosoma theileri]|uniref:Putative ATP-dependent RNA helicase n=1 Tax=Trypanosoma theileri TaxID=67003 RepID=A0A1X0NJ25_9TRYP|nr:putative ATP-dependent RNA helicase [Trypanosoma theileri]ORC84752.1 putative ATP-dependent RNA helicase [Trypanosoma theileri]